MQPTDRAGAERRRSSSTTRSACEETFGQYFKEQVRRELVERFGWERVYQGGLKVYTTIDLDMQKAAEAEVERGIAGHRAPASASHASERRARASPLQGALVAMDPRTGDVRAMVGGRDFEREPLQPRDPGEAPAGLGVQAVRLRGRARSAATRRPRSSRISTTRS